MQPHDPKVTRTKRNSSQTPAGCPVACGFKCAAVVLVSILGSCERSGLGDGLAENRDCSACHGSKANAAPPKAVNGSTDTHEIGVGAHQAHLVAGKVAAAIACTECHPLPTDLLTHPALQSRPAAVTFGAKASLYGVAPVWDRTKATCADTYCHGAKLSGAANRADPIWTMVDGRQRDCGSCHGNPPAGDHPSSPACYVCHGEVVSADGTIRDVTRHIDGNVDFYVAPDAGVILGDAGASSAAATGGGNQ